MKHVDKVGTRRMTDAAARIDDQQFRVARTLHGL